ncbi:MAG: hypothetical protein AAFZ05_08945, partial [Pseudomonadota bacterium]
MAAHVAVAAVSAIVGFGAVYWTGKATANPPASALLKQHASPASSDDATPAQTSKSAEAASPSVTRVAAPAALPTSPGRNDLSVGDMAMFVFRAPQALPEVAFNGPDGTPMSFDAWSGRVVLVN